MCTTDYIATQRLASTTLSWPHDNPMHMTTTKATGNYDEANTGANTGANTEEGQVPALGASSMLTLYESSRPKPAGPTARPERPRGAQEVPSRSPPLPI